MLLRIALLLCLLVFPFGGCGVVDSYSNLDMSLAADASSYRSGESVTLTLVNHSTRAFTIHPELCGTVLQRRDERTWQTVTDDASGVCTDIGTSLEPGRRLTGEHSLPASLPAARYRIMYELREWDHGARYRREERIELYTQEFDVSTRAEE